MRRIFASLAAFMVLVLTLEPAKSALLVEQPYRFDRNGRLLTEVYLDGKGPFSFLIDTASSRSLIFAHVQSALGLTQSGPRLLTIYGINEIATAVPVRPQLRIGDEVIGGLTMGVLPDPANPADEPDGVLGIDVLAHYFVVLDRAAMRFELRSPDDNAQDYSDWTHASLTPHPLKDIPLDFWYLRLHYDGVNLMTLFDLGASITLLNWPAAELLGVHERDYRHLGPPPEELRDVLGANAPAIRILNLDIAISDMEWHQQLGLVSAAPVFAWFDLDEKPAVIAGAGLFTDNSLAIDFKDHRLFIGPPVTGAQAKRAGQGQ